MAVNFNIEIEYKHVPRLESGSDASIEYLEEQGYVVIKNALSESEAAKTLDLLWDYLEELNTGIDRYDPSTWEDDRWPTCAHGGIMPSYGIGHSESQWFLRGIPNVKKAFAKIWESDDFEIWKVDKKRKNNIRIKIRHTLNVGKVCISRKKSSWPHLGHFKPIFPWTGKLQKLYFFVNFPCWAIMHPLLLSTLGGQWLTW